MAVRRISAAGLGKTLDRAVLPIYVMDEAGRIVFVNQACAVSTGWAPEELVGQQCLYSSSPQLTGAALTAAQLSPPPQAFIGQDVACSLGWSKPDGQPVSAWVRFFSLGGSDDEPGGVLAVLDLSNLRGGADDAGASPVDHDSERLHERLKRFRQALSGRFHLDRFIGESSALRQVRAQIVLASGSHASVVVAGPNGSGRQHVARAIHYSQDHYSQNHRAAGDFIPLACSQLGTELLESTLAALGRRSASRDRKSVDTLFLNEVDQLPCEVQAELMRFCRDRTASTRIISASREPLSVLAARGDFRQDLAHSLETVSIVLPPLSARLDDLPLLAQRFLEEENARGGKQVGGFSTEALDRLMAHPWTGNLAELEEVVRQAHARSGSARIQPGDLPSGLELAASAAQQPRRAEEKIVLEQYLAGIELELIQRALARAKGNKAKAARLLGMTRPRLYRRLVQLGLEPPEAAAE